MKKIDDINSKIEKLFNATYAQNNFGTNELLVPGFYNPNMFDKNAEILFVGMNPAGYLEDFYSWKRKYIDINQVDKRKKIESESYKGEENPYSYYKSLIELIPDINGIYNWNHIDLFQFRGTQQGKVTQAINNHKDFFDKQYEITIDLINALKPKIIVVVNGGASRVLKEEWYGDSHKEIGKKGYWESPEGVFEDKYPILFTGMLSGQRAMDVGSRDMLKFHIDKILKSIKNKV